MYYLIAVEDLAVDQLGLVAFYSGFSMYITSSKLSVIVNNYAAYLLVEAITHYKMTC